MPLDIFLPPANAPAVATLSVLPPDLPLQHDHTPNDADSADAVLAWVAATFAGRRVVATTGFGMEGCVLLDLLDRADLAIPVIWLDTGFLFDETHDLRRRLKARYPRLSFVRHAIDLSPDEQDLALGPRLWQRDPDRCCGLRKVVPMRRAMADADVWLTALRRDQSPERATLPVVGRDATNSVWKVCPLLTWDRPRVWQYVIDHDVPFNVLHEREYPTVGCTHCTRPVPGSRPDQYTRTGRWTGTAKTECGLHGAGI
jgi:phosphoadenosine phosphosulfate reductase